MTNKGAPARLIGLLLLTNSELSLIPADPLCTPDIRRQRTRMAVVAHAFMYSCRRDGSV